MRTIKLTTTLLIAVFFVGCASKIGAGRSNISDMPEWYKNIRAYKYHEPDARIYGKGFAEELFLNQAMNNADNIALSDLSRQVNVYSKRSDVMKNISSNAKQTNSGQKSKKDNKTTTTRQAKSYSEQIIENIAQEILTRPAQEIADTWEVEKEGTTLYRSWTIWSISIESIEKSLLERMEEDPEFFDAVTKLYLK
ncbi:MAG: hypothetical protein HOK94_05535 [Candidatus Marinimicrobia bacterium]|jgi:hypothetical protein|nr:hypothetical protein [Candidatus Neomarinimicrobiota bacterium]MBT3962202.1 hypothetical protein [Candidatus Neomarinimicrobiota bacterium]MBT5461090.1 hypothetical protein [Candidatus Neomarinimicrobiota bacterium]MBT7270397.1 hypothetical protein [Candidatus Neomarinimicrobiota bacterium]MBT7899352.1 hypothetical protein [Candidatus Neomarinimicrobiota bacterium]